MDITVSWREQNCHVMPRAVSLPPEDKQMLVFCCVSEEKWLSKQVCW